MSTGMKDFLPQNQELHAASASNGEVGSSQPMTPPKKSRVDKFDPGLNAVTPEKPADTAAHIQLEKRPAPFGKPPEIDTVLRAPKKTTTEQKPAAKRRRTCVNQDKELEEGRADQKLGKDDLLQPPEGSDSEEICWKSGVCFRLCCG